LGVIVAGALAIGTITTAAVVSTALLPIYSLTARSLIAFPFDFAQGMFAGFAEAISGFFAPVFGFVKRKSKQGVAFDGLSSTALAGVYVLMFSKSGNLQTCFTDQNGRYSVKLRPDNYSLRAEKFNYIFPSKLVTVPANQNFSHIYSPGENIQVLGESKDVSDIAVPLDPNLTISPFNKMLVKFGDFISFMIKKMGVPLAIISLAVSGFAAYSDPNPFYTIVFLVLTTIYIYQLIGLIRGRSKPDQVSNT